MSAVFVALLLWFDVVGLWHLVTHTDVGVLAIFLLWFFHGTVFGSAQFAIKLMLDAKDDDDDDDHRGQLMPVVVPAKAQRRL